MNIEQARQIVAAYIADWTTEKLLSVRAFAEDGRMDMLNPCCCLIGVESSDVLHEYCTLVHYTALKGYKGPRAQEAEYAYMELCFALGSKDREFLAILHAELERRPPLVIEISELDAVEIQGVLAC